MFDLNELEEKFSKWGIVCIQSILEATMDQLLKRRAEAEHAIKGLESFYAETVVTSKSCSPSPAANKPIYVPTQFSCSLN